MFGRRRGSRYGIGHSVTKNHFQMTFATTGGTELQTAVATGIDAPNDRGIDVPENSILRSVLVNLSADAIVVGKHQCLLIRRPGASALASPITNFFATTDPATEDMIEVRRQAMGTVHTKHSVAGGFEPVRFSCRWKGAMKMYDGDDVMLVLLDGTSTTYDAQVWLTFTR